jgi:hypothetical protein
MLDSRKAKLRAKDGRRDGVARREDATSCGPRRPMQKTVGRDFRSTRATLIRCNLQSLRNTNDTRRFRAGARCEQGETVLSEAREKSQPESRQTSPPPPPSTSLINQLYRRLANCVLCRIMMNEDTETSTTALPVAMKTMTKSVPDTSTSGHDIQGARTRTMRNCTDDALMNVTEKTKRTRGANCQDH